MKSSKYISETDKGDKEGQKNNLNGRSKSTKQKSKSTKATKEFIMRDKECRVLLSEERKKWKKRKKGKVFEFESMARNMAISNGNTKSDIKRQERSASTRSKIKPSIEKKEWRCFHRWRIKPECRNRPAIRTIY